jgi:hypothetical protein
MLGEDWLIYAQFFNDVLIILLLYINKLLAA